MFTVTLSSWPDRMKKMAGTKLCPTVNTLAWIFTALGRFLDFVLGPELQFSLLMSASFHSGQMKDPPNMSAFDTDNNVLTKNIRLA